MSAAYPGAVKTFATRNNGDVIQATHVGDLQDEVTAIEDGLLNGKAPLNSSNSTLANLSVLGGSTFASLTLTAQQRSILFHSTIQSLNDSALTALTFDSEDLDVGSMHSTSVTPTRVTIPAGGGGFYRIYAQTWFNANATGFRELALYKNGTGGTLLQTSYLQAGTNGITVTIEWSGTLIAGDYVEVYGQQTSGGGLALGGGTRDHCTYFSVVRLP